MTSFLRGSWVDYLLRTYCTILAVAIVAYVAWVARMGWGLYPTGLIVAFILSALGWLPALARDAERHHAWLAVASLLAMPLSGPVFGPIMHDLSTRIPALGHHRWCMPEPGTLITSVTVPLLLFVPLLLASCGRWYLLRRARRNTTLHESPRDPSAPSSAP